MLRDGAPVYASANVDAAPSHVYAAGSAPLFATVGLVSTKVALGGAMGVTATLAEAAPVPFALVAVTAQPYVVLLVNPLTVIGLVAPVPVHATPAAEQVAV